MKKTLRFMELMWLFILCFCIVISILKFVGGNTGDGFFFILFGATAFILYLLRKHQRKKL